MFLDVFCSPHYQQQQWQDVELFPLFRPSHSPKEKNPKPSSSETTPAVKTVGRRFKLFVALVVEIETFELLKEAKELASTQIDSFPKWSATAGALCSVWIPTRNPHSVHPPPGFASVLSRTYHDHSYTVFHL